MNASSTFVASMVACMAGALLLALVGTRSPVETSDLENEVKVEFIERFTRFVEWPDEKERESGLVIGVIGEGSLVAHLEHGLQNRLIDDRLPEMRRRSELEELERCHLVYIAPSERERLDEILEHTSGRLILTVSDAPGFARAGVIINLIREDEYLRFEINRHSADLSGLRMSSKLMRLAIIVSKG